MEKTNAKIPNNKKYDAIFFSPHLDDAVLSAGNCITKLRQNNNAVLIISIFTTAYEFPSRDAFQFTKSCGYESPKAFFAARKKEDLDAVKLLGADATHLDFIDGGFRPDHPNFNTVFSPKLTNNDLQLVETIANALKNSIAKIAKPTTKLFFPLAVGNHVDHQIVTLISKKIWMPRENWQLIFWEDIPYRNQTGATIARQAKIPELILGCQPTLLRSSQNVAQLKHKAIAAYTSQVGSLLATGGYSPSYDDFVECFWYV